MAARLATTAEANGISVLFVLPIALLAVAFGLRGGAVGAAIGIVLLSVWAATSRSLDATGWATRITSMLLLGVLLGDAVDRAAASERRAGEQEAARLAAEERNRRHDAALEIHDSILQSLVVAKWRAEAGDVQGIVTTLDGAIKRSQTIVSELLDAQITPGTLVRRAPATSDPPKRTPD